MQQCRLRISSDTDASNLYTGLRFKSSDRQSSVSDLCFPETVKKNDGKIPPNWPRPLPSTSCPIHQSLISLSFDATVLTINRDVKRNVNIVKLINSESDGCFLERICNRSRRVQFHWGSCKVIGSRSRGCSLTEVQAKWLRAEQEDAVSLRFRQSDWEQIKRVQSHWGSCKVIESRAGGCSLTEVHAKWLRAEQECASHWGSRKVIESGAEVCSFTELHAKWLTAEQEGAVWLRFMQSDWERSRNVQSHWGSRKVIESGAEVCSFTEVQAKWLRAQKEAGVSLRFTQSDWERRWVQSHWGSRKVIESNVLRKGLFHDYEWNRREVTTEFVIDSKWQDYSSRIKVLDMQITKTSEKYVRTLPTNLLENAHLQDQAIKLCSTNPGCEYTRWILRSSGGFVTTCQTTRHHIQDDSNLRCCHSLNYDMPETS
jgi:hypothetical protein